MTAPNASTRLITVQHDDDEDLFRSPRLGNGAVGLIFDERIYLCRSQSLGSDPMFMYKVFNYNI